MKKLVTVLVLFLVFISVKPEIVLGQGYSVILETLLNKTEIKRQIALSYGSGEFSRFGLNGSTSSLSMIGGSVGISVKFKDYPANDYIGLNFNSGSTNGAPNSSLTFKEVGLGQTNALACTMIGFENRQGLGYSMGGNTDFLLSTGGAWTWTSVSPKSYAASNPDDWQMVDDFSSGLNFGSTWSPGVEITSGSSFSVRMGYNQTQIYPRHMYWYWISSELIENFAQTGAHYLIDAVSKKGDSSYPIVNFVVTNAFTYMFNQLRTERMNWPWATVPPMNLTYWNLAVNYNF